MNDRPGVEPRRLRLRSLLPSGTTADAERLLAARAVRGFGDGFVSVLLPVHLAALGFGAAGIGVIATATLLGSAALTLAVGLLAGRWSRRTLLRRASWLMVLTGLGFALLGDFWPLLLIAFVGTLNPSSGDVSAFLPVEQALLPTTVPRAGRTALFARYSLAGALAAAVGALLAGLPEAVATRLDVSQDGPIRAMFFLYGLLGLAILWLYRGLSPALEPAGPAATAPLRQSRAIVTRLAALFSLDSFAGGFAVQSIIALWLFERFDLSVATAGAIFFWAGLLSAFSQLVAARLAARIGLIETMVFTHLPANCFLILAPFMPTLPLALACLLARSALSQMDVPARTSYVMAVVPPEERAAAASVTNVPRSLAAAFGPLLAGALLARSDFGWPLVVAGVLKAVYDLLLLTQFRSVRPPEEVGARDPARPASG
jgi:MFS family permease